MLPDNRSSEVPGLEAYLKAVLRRLWLVGLCLAAVLGLGLLYLSTRSLDYTASSRVLVGPTPYGATRQDQLVEPNLEREREVLTSLEVAELVQKRFGLEADGSELFGGLAVMFQPKTDTLRVTYTDADPSRAATYANAFADAYVDLRESQRAEYFRSQIGAVDVRLADVREGLAEVGGELERLTAERAALTAGGAPATEVAAVDSLLLALRSDQSQYSNEQRNLTTARSALLAEESVQVPAARRLSTARPPSTPNGMGASTVLALALIAGTGMGVAAALVADRLDTRTRNRFDLERLLGSPTLASVPPLGWRVRLGGNGLVMASARQDTSSHMAREAFRRLRSSLQFIQTRQDSDLFLFTSANPGEGKTTVVANTAVAIARSGRSVAVVSADIRRPRIDSLFGLESYRGLSEYLEGDLEGDDEVELASSGIEGLSILPAGRPSANTTELLGSERMKQLLVSLHETFDMVLVDTPPVLATADTGTIAPFGGAVVLVVDAKNTPLEDLAVLRAELQRVGAVVIGSVLNRDSSQLRGRFSLRRRKRYYGQPSTQAEAAVAP